MAAMLEVSRVLRETDRREGPRAPLVPIPGLFLLNLFPALPKLSSI